MPWTIKTSGNSNNHLPRGNHSISHPTLIGEPLETPKSAFPTDKTQVIETPSGSPEGYEPSFSYPSDASGTMDETESVEPPHQAELEETEQQNDGYEEDSDSGSSMEEFGLKYNEDSYTLRESNEESDEAPEYPAPSEGLSEPMRARNRSGPPIPPPEPVRPGQLFFSNQIWTRLNVEQQLKLGALKVGSKNKSFKTRPWLVVEKSNRVDSDGQQMLWVMCCTTRNRNGWEGVSYRDSKSFIPMAPTPSRFGRPVLPLVTDDRDVFLGGSLLFLEVFKEIKPALLGDYIGYISDESVRIVNKEQLRIAEERRKKEELRAAHPASFKARGGSNRRGNERYRARAETYPDHRENRRSGRSGQQYGHGGWATPTPIPPFHLPPCTDETLVSPPLNPKAPAFRVPVGQGHKDNRRKSFNGRVTQNRPQHNQGHQNYANFNQMPEHGNHAPQGYGGHGNYGKPGGYSSYGGHENNGHHGTRHRSGSDGRRGYSGPQQNYRGHQNSGYSPNSTSDLGHMLPSSGSHGHPGGNDGNSVWVSGGFAQGGAGWTATPCRDQRR